MILGSAAVVLKSSNSDGLVSLGSKTSIADCKQHSAVTTYLGILVTLKALKKFSSWMQVYHMSYLTYAYSEILLLGLLLTFHFLLYLAGSSSSYILPGQC